MTIGTYLDLIAGSLALKQCFNEAEVSAHELESHKKLLSVVFRPPIC